MLTNIILKSNRRIVVDYDDCPESPRQWCNYSRLLCIENRYFSLDENLSQEDLMNEHKAALKRGDFVFPLYAFVHSGVIFSINPFSCSWDSGLCGIAIVSKENAKTKIEAEKIIKHEIKVLNDYMEGRVYVVFIQHSDNFDIVTDDCLAGNYINNESDLIDILEGLDLTNAELKEAVERVSELMI